MKAVKTQGVAKRGRPRKVVSTQEDVTKKYFGKDLTIKDAFEAMGTLEQRVAILEKRTR